MNIIFVAPDFPEKSNTYLMLPSLDLTIMSAALKEKGHNCSLIDMRINEYNFNDLKRILLTEERKEHIDLICIDGLVDTHCNVNKAIKTCKYVLRETPIALRGEVATFLPKEMLLRNYCLDYVMSGESEETILELVDYLSGKGGGLTDIMSLSFREKGTNEIVVNSKRISLKNLDELPYPDRNLYDIKKYLKRDSETIVRSSRGCPGNCAFCIYTKLTPFRLFSVQRFCDEIEELQRYGFESFFFSDYTFAFSDKRVEDFYQETQKRNLHVKFTSNIRIKDINEFKIKRMKEIGAYRVFVGIETINSNSSELINKNITKEEIIHKIEILKKYDIEYHGSFIIGNPGDTEDDLKATEELLGELNPTVVTFNHLKMMPGTDIYNRPNDFDILPFDPFWFEKDDWSYYPSAGTNQLPPDKILYWSERLAKAFIKNEVNHIFSAQ